VGTGLLQRCLMDNNLQPAPTTDKIAVRRIAVRLLDEWKAIVTHPGVYLEGTSLEGGLKEPVIFIASVAAVNAVLSLVIDLRHPVVALIWAVILFICLIAFSFVWAGITMLLARRLGGQGNFEKTYRACAYAMAPNVVLPLPLLNFFLGLYSAYLFKQAIEKVHGLPSTRAKMIVFAEMGFGLIIGLALLFS